MTNASVATPPQPPNATAFTTLLFVKFRSHVEEVLGRSSTIPSYTPHGLSHIQGVESALEYLSEFLEEEDRPDVKPLTSLERILLRFCAWSHDLGMIEEVANKYQEDRGRPKPWATELLRKEHDKASSYFVQLNVPGQFEEIQNSLQSHVSMALEIARGVLMKRAESELTEATLQNTIRFFQDSANRQRWSAHAATLANTINLIARYHRRAEAIDTAPRLRHFLNEPIRLRLLAAIFRLADALHVDRTRFEQQGYDLLSQSPQFTDESRVHWIKSFIVSSIRIDKQAHTVHVQADVPVAYELGGSDFALTSDRMRGMVEYIVNDLQEDVLSVSRILLDAGFPAMLGVTSEIHEIPAMHYPLDVRSALNHIYASSSPNTSRLITIALDVLQWNLREAEKPQNGTPYLKQKIAEQRSSLAEQLHRRTCHEALRKVHDLLSAVDEAWNKRGDFPKNQLSQMYGERYTLNTFLDGVRETFRFKRSEVLAGANSDIFQQIFVGRSDIVLYGFSEQVLEFLMKLSNRGKRPDVHVLECRTKTSYAPAGDLLYLDGAQYAIALRDRGYRGNVTLEPDAAVGRILTNSAAPLVLLGTNAVYPSGEFVHSMGHLTVAAAAKAPHLTGKGKVVVLTDTMKIGVQHESESHERNEDKWLTPRKEVIERVKKAGITLHNWQEDVVPAALIDNLLVLDAPDDKKILRAPYTDLEGLRFAASEDYCNNLDNRLLASYIAYAFGALDAAKQEEIQKRAAPHEDINVGNWNTAVAYTANPESLPAWMRQFLDGLWLQRQEAVIKAKRIITEEYSKLAFTPLIRLAKRAAGVGGSEEPPQFNVRSTAPLLTI